MECLVTKLKGVVNDDSLLGLNKLRLTVQHITGVEGIQFTVTEPITVKSLKGGMISLKSTTGFTQSVEITNINNPISISYSVEFYAVGLKLRLFNIYRIGHSYVSSYIYLCWHKSTLSHLHLKSRLSEITFQDLVVSY